MFLAVSLNTHSEVLVMASVVSLLVMDISSFINISVMYLGQPYTGCLCAAKHPEVCLQPLCVHQLICSKIN